MDHDDVMLHSSEQWHPLSSAQRNFWFLYKLRPELRGTHNIGFCIRFTSKLDVIRLGRALNLLSSRHPMLRARFRELDERLEQCIVPDVIVPVEVFEADAIDDTALKQKVAEDHARPFDLEFAPLIRASVYHLSDRQSLLLLVIDHIICDGWSYWILLKELSGILDGSEDLAAEAQPRYDEPNYFEYIKHQQNWLDSRQGAKQFSYWQQALRENQPVLNLPTPAVPVTSGSAEQGVTRCILPAELKEKLHGLAGKHRTSLYVLLLTAYFILLHRLTGHESLAAGSPMPARDGRKWHHIVGPFFNTVVLQASFWPGVTVAELLREIGRTAFRALANQSYPVNDLVERLSPARNRRGHPYFQTVFAFQNARGVADALGLVAGANSHIPIRWGGYEAFPFWRPINIGAGFDLSLEVVEVGENIIGWLEYASALFAPETIERYLGYWRRLLEGMVADDSQAVDRLSLLSADERHRVLAEWNATDQDYPADRCVHELFEARTERTTGAVAVVFGDRQLSYGDLNTQANRLAHHLRGLGVKPDDRVAICVERSVEMVIGLLAILKAGGAYVPLDPAFPAERLAFMLKDSTPVVLLTDRAGKTVLAGCGVNVPAIDLAEAHLWAGKPAANLDCASFGLNSRHLAYVIYTSGSTGVPKGVMVEHRGVVNQVAALQKRYALLSDDRILQFSSTTFDMSVEEIFGALVSGASLILRTDAWLIGDTFWTLCHQWRISVANLPALFWQQLGQGNIDAIPSGLRLVSIGGEAASGTAIAAWFQREGHLPRLFNAYGPTEATVNAAINEITSHNLNSNCIGRPISNTRIYILDGHGEPVPVGVAGELYIGGAGVARGYLNRPELTAERFLPDPFAGKPDVRMYRTGDLGRWLSDGTIEFLGRNDFQVKIRGFRIELGEIEARLEKHPAVRQAAVAVRDDQPGEKRLVAYYAGEDGVGAQELRAHLDAALPDYMVPAAYVRLDRIPLTPNGKLDRQALPAPDGDAYARSGYEPPVGATEEKLARIWAELLGVEQVGRHDNFFELGGHSLLAVTLISRLRQTLSIEVPLAEVFAGPTLSDLARFIEGVSASTLPAIAADPVPALMQQLADLGVRLTAEDGRLRVNAPKGILTDTLKAALTEHRNEILRRLDEGRQPPVTGEPVLRRIDRTTPLPLTSVQRRFWFLDRIGQGEGYPNVSISLRLEGDFNAVAMRAALMLLFERHELLRLRLGDKQGEPWPEIGAVREDTVSVVDLAGRLKTEAEEEGTRLCHDLIHTRFDLVNGPVARALLVRVAPDVNLVTVCMHHIVSDGWSSSIIVRELRETYAALKRNVEPALPPLALQYVDYAAWEAAQARSAMFERQLAYWKTKLKGAPPILALPADHPRRSQQSLRGARYDCIVEADLVQRLQQFSQCHDATLFMTILAAFGVVLHRLSGQEDIVVGTPMANRANDDLERVVGPFVNSLSLRLNIGGDPRFTDYLAQVRRTVIEAIDNRDLPFDMVVEAINPARTLNHAPIFQVMFALHNFPMEPPRFDDLTASFIIPETKVARLDILLDMVVLEGRLYGLWEYDAELFDRSTIERMHAGLIEVVNGFLATEEALLRTLPLRTADEDRLLDRWNSTAAGHDRSLCIHHLFERVAKLTPQAPAVVVGEESFTYGDIDVHANRLARLLRRRGVNVGDRVALCLDRTIDMPIAVAAVLKAGAAYVPLDPAHPAERLRHVIEDARVACVVTTLPLNGVLPETGVPRICLDAAAAELATLDSSAPDAAVGPAHLAYVIYTSGSTGRPKGVEVEHRNLVSFIAAMRREPGLTASDVLLAVTTLSFDIAGLEIWLPLSVGARIVLASRTDALEGSRLNDLVARHGVTVMQATPSTWRLMIGAGFQGKPDLKALCGGEALPPDLAVELIPRVAHLWNMYGPTETTVWSTASRVVGVGVPPIGRPIANTRVYVVEPSGELAPLGGFGELLIGGEGVARGYWNRPELTAERFGTIRLPGGQIERVYRTGDIVRFRNDGQLEFHGRCDHQIKLRGYRIEPGEIEATLAAEAPIEACVVTVWEPEPGDARLVAYMVPKPGATLDREDVRTRLKTHLPGYMVPLEFVVLNSLPLTPNGKVDRAALPAPSPETAVAREPSADVVMTPVQQRVAGIWCQVLRVDRVLLYDNFFDVGGHSMLVVRLHAALQQEFETDMALAELFQRTTVAAQAERVSEAGRGDTALRRAEARVRRRLHG
jgi:amino acid adenylation domain-containing protein